MARIPTREEAEGELFKAIHEFDWAVFLDNLDDKELFLTNYRALSAQLRRGDKLSIKVRKIEKDIGELRGCDHSYPYFGIFLRKADGSEEDVTRNTLLYD